MSNIKIILKLPVDGNTCVEDDWLAESGRIP